jgi:hypothetical protein
MCEFPVAREKAATELSHAFVNQGFCNSDEADFDDSEVLSRAASSPSAASSAPMCLRVKRRTLRRKSARVALGTLLQTLFKRHFSDIYPSFVGRSSSAFLENRGRRHLGPSRNTLRPR